MTQSFSFDLRVWPPLISHVCVSVQPAALVAGQGRPISLGRTNPCGQDMRTACPVCSRIPVERSSPPLSC
jgi:hypothetical protein